MITIYKYPLTKVGDVALKECDEEFRILGLIEVLSAERDPEGRMCIWVKVNTDAQNEETVAVYIRGTGHDISSMRATFLSTVVCPPYVWHIFIGY